VRGREVEEVGERGMWWEGQGCTLDDDFWT
jgi:hypothetical protein